MAKEAPTLDDLMKMCATDKAVAINKLNKDPRGDLLEEALTEIYLLNIRVTEHPFLIAAHKRAKRAEKKLQEAPNEGREVRNIARKIKTLEKQRDNDKQRADAAIEKLTTQEKLLSNHRQTIEELESECAEAHNEVIELRKDVDAFKALYNSKVDVTPLMVRLGRRGHLME